MANPPNKQQTPQQDKPREAREDFERKPPKVDEAKEGLPGYGQPPEEVREKQLPDQKW